MSTEHEHPSTPVSDPEALWRENLLLRLDRLIAQQETLVQLHCPVCAPELVKRQHPDADATVEVARGLNGSGHGG